MPSRDVLLNDRSLQVSEVELVEDALSGGLGSAPIPVLDANGQPITLSRIAATLAAKRVVDIDLTLNRGLGAAINTRNGELSGVNFNSNGDDAYMSFGLPLDVDVTTDAVVTFEFYAVNNNGGPNPLQVQIQPLLDGVDVDTTAPLVDTNIIRNGGNAGTVFIETVTIPAADLATMGAGTGVIVHMTRIAASGTFALVRGKATLTLAPSLLP